MLKNNFGNFGIFDIKRENCLISIVVNVDLRVVIWEGFSTTVDLDHFFKKQNTEATIEDYSVKVEYAKNYNFS